MTTVLGLDSADVDHENQVYFIHTVAVLTLIYLI